MILKQNFIYHLVLNFNLKFPTELAIYDNTMAIRLVTLRALPSLSIAPKFHVI